MKYPEKLKPVEVRGPDPSHAAIDTHWGSVISVGLHSYKLASWGHGPFLIIKSWDSREAGTPRSGLLLERNQVEQLIAELQRLLPNVQDGPEAL